MKLRKIGAFGVALVVLAALIGFFLPNANAATTPPWEVDPGALGTLSFYNSTGGVVTSGNDLSNLFSYAEASNNQFDGSDVISQGFTKAQLAYAWPNHSQSTALWFADAPYPASSFPNSNAPAPLKTSTNPVATSTTNGSSNFAGIENAGTNDTTTGYNHVIQVRMYLTGLGGIATSPNYWETDIQVDLTANTWTQIYPAPVAGPTATTTTVSASPASPQLSGTNVTFTATVSPTAAGTVQFFDNGTAVGGAATVTAGKATFASNSLGVGTHPITATFTPTDTTAFSGSTSSTFNYTINAPAVTTTTTLTANPSGPITVGTPTTLTAQLSPNTAVGTVQFKDGTTNLGAAVAVSSGQAVSTSQNFAVGTHSLSAVFTPTSSAAFVASTGTLSYEVDSVPLTPTTTTLTATPTGTQTFGSSVGLSASVSPNTAAGSVKFLDGSTVIATVPVSSGTASTSTTSLNAGTHTLTAQFVPGPSSTFSGSTSTPATTYTVTAESTSVSLGVSPTTSARFGSSVTITGTVTPSAAAGSITFKYLPGDVTIGTATVSGGAAHVTSSTLPESLTGIEAVFTPTSANYSASPNAQIGYSITPPPPGDTSTALMVTPAGGQANQGATETLRAVVTPSSAAGAVQFMDGTTMLGSPVAVASGVASTTTVLPLGGHSIVAMFVPSNTTLFNGSNSSAVSYTVLPPATATATSLAIGPGSSEPYGTDVTFTATVNQAAAGTVRFTDGSITLATVATTVGSDTATATFSTVGLQGGAHNVVATFVPTSALLFVGSASDPGSITITAVATTTSLAVSPAGPVTHGAKVTLKATVTPSNAAGSVTFFNGATSLGTATVTSGVATLVSTTIAVGDAMLTATFNATHAADFVTSASHAVSLLVVAAPKITAVYDNGKLISAGGKVARSSTVQIHATGFQPSEKVKVYLHSTPTLVDTVTSSPTGEVVVNVVIPAATPLGAHSLQLVGSIGTVSFPITVVAAATSGSGSGSGGGGLADTGADVQIGIVTGLLLLIGGLVLIGAARRRGVRG